MSSSFPRRGPSPWRVPRWKSSLSQPQRFAVGKRKGLVPPSSRGRLPNGLGRKGERRPAFRRRFSAAHPRATNGVFTEPPRRLQVQAAPGCCHASARRQSTTEGNCLRLRRLGGEGGSRPDRPACGAARVLWTRGIRDAERSPLLGRAMPADKAAERSLGSRRLRSRRELREPAPPGEDALQRRRRSPFRREAKPAALRQPPPLFGRAEQRLTARRTHPSSEGRQKPGALGASSQLEQHQGSSELR